MPPPRRVPEFDAEFVRDVSEAVYRQRMSGTDAAKMIAEIGPAKFRDHAGSYDALTRCYLRTLKVTASLEISR